MNKIISIKEVDFLYNGGNYSGYCVKTEQKTVMVGVSSGQQCCEDFGYICSEDKPDYFIGADLLSVNVVDTALNKKCEVDYYSGGVMFVDFETSKGVFQLVVYNSHNGYYGHEAVVLDGDKVLPEETL